MFRDEVVRPEVVRPEVVRAEVVRSEVARPEVVRPELIRPEVIGPEVLRCEVVRPVVVHPEVVRPAVLRLDSDLNWTRNDDMKLRFTSLRFATIWTRRGGRQRLVLSLFLPATQFQTAVGRQASGFLFFSDNYNSRQR